MDRRLPIEILEAVEPRASLKAAVAGLGWLQMRSVNEKWITFEYQQGRVRVPRSNLTEYEVTRTINHPCLTAPQ